MGAISVASNLFPGLYARLLRTPDPELAASLADLIDWLFSEPNPIPLNTARVLWALYFLCLCYVDIITSISTS